MPLNFRLQHFLKTGGFCKRNKEGAVWHAVCSDLFGVKLNMHVALAVPVSSSFLLLDASVVLEQTGEG